MKNKIVTHFYVMEARKDSKGLAPIYLRITINGERAEISTDKKIVPESWDKSNERVAGRSEPARIINSFLDTLAGKVVKYFSNLDAKDEIISVDQIISEIKGKVRNQMTLVKAYEHHISTIKPLLGIEFAETTIDKYGYALSSIKKFLKSQYNKQDIRLCELNRGFIETYYIFLRTKDNLMQNSATKYIKILFRIINVSISNKWIISNPFEDFSINYVNPQQINRELRFFC